MSYILNKYDIYIYIHEWLYKKYKSKYLHIKNSDALTINVPDLIVNYFSIQYN